MKKVEIIVTKFQFLYDRNYFRIKLILVTLFSTEIFAVENEIVGLGLTEDNLLYYVQQNYTPENIPNYNSSRDIIFSTLDNHNNIVSGVYSGYSITINGGYCDCENGNSSCIEADMVMPFRFDRVKAPKNWVEWNTCFNDVVI